MSETTTEVMTMSVELMTILSAVLSSTDCIASAVDDIQLSSGTENIFERCSVYSHRIQIRQVMTHHLAYLDPTDDVDALAMPLPA